ncbi:MAG: SDR family oxidoreductase [Gammaproteobacteria bacterium]|nr:SDR family oxidoreductase [Gammaproteobacteria bacterium]
MDLQLQDKTCLVTGASAGIGVGIARVLAREGVKLAITARRRERLDSLAADIEAETGRKPLVVVADVTDASAPGIIKRAVDDAFGDLEILVNNAGSSFPMAPDAPDAQWNAGIDLKFSSLRRITTPFLAGMRARKWGRIINITGTMEPLGTNAAAAACAATHAWAKGLSRDLGADGITVNCIPPGRIMSEQIVERLHPTEESRQRFIEEHIPAGYFGEPEDIANLVAFLASPLARYINGCVIYVDGGMHRYVH